MFVEHVAVLIVGCAMDKIEVFHQHRTPIQIEQPLRVFVKQLLSCPT